MFIQTIYCLIRMLAFKRLSLQKHKCKFGSLALDQAKKLCFIHTHLTTQALMKLN